MSTELRRARSRQMAIFLLVCVGMAVLLSKLFYWQVVQASDLTRRANAEHIQNQILSAPRGLIYDAQGRLLATNVVRDDVYIEPIQFATDHKDSYQNDLLLQIHALRQALPAVSEDTLRAAFAVQQPTTRIASHIEPAQSQQLRKLQLPDTFLQPHTWRIYPGGDLASQVLGYVHDDQGVYGIEGKYNQLLMGKAGSFTAETDLNRNPLTVGASSAQAPVKGANLTLTLDSIVQYQVQSALADTITKMQALSGTVVVLNARTGAVVAMAGYPSFDPNNYGAFADTKGCLNTEDVYFNPALFCAYEPGSTLKAITMAAALDQNVITPDMAINDPGYQAFPDASTVYNCCGANSRAYGNETMTQVLQHSANVGASNVAYFKLGADRYYPYLQRFGFGVRTGLFEPEAAGSYRTKGDAGWTPSDLTRQSFGQSILATPLQVAQAFQAIANGGVMMKPYLVSRVDNNGQVQTMRPQIQRTVIGAAASKALTGMLMNVADYNKSVTNLPGYSLAFKTGTATTQGISTDQTEASMAGFFPASDPQFVILAKIDQPQANIYGGVAAGPLWKTVAQDLIWRYAISPDLS